MLKKNKCFWGSISWFSKFSDKWSFVWIVNDNSVKLQWYMIHILMIQWKVYQEEEQDRQCLTNSMQLEVNCSMFFNTDGKRINMFLWRLSLHSHFLVSTTFSSPFFIPWLECPKTHWIMSQCVRARQEMTIELFENNSRAF